MQIFEGHKDAYGLILVLVFCLLVAVGILSLLLYKKTKKVMVQLANSNSNQVTNLQMLTTASGGETKAAGCGRNAYSDKVNYSLANPAAEGWA